MMNNQTKTLLGFASKSGKLVSGENTCKARMKEIKMIILSNDCREDMVVRYQNKFPNRLYRLGDRYELGIAIGKSPRTIIGITDHQFARSIEESMKK